VGHVFLLIQSNTRNSSVQNGNHILGRRAREGAERGATDEDKQEVGGGEST